MKIVIDLNYSDLGDVIEENENVLILRPLKEGEEVSKMSLDMMTAIVENLLVDMLLKEFTAGNITITSPVVIVMHPSKIALGIIFAIKTIFTDVSLWVVDGHKSYMNFSHFEALGWDFIHKLNKAYDKGGDIESEKETTIETPSEQVQKSE